MRFTLALAAASVASASILPRGGWKSGPHVPDHEITKFTVVPLADAKQGKFREIQAGHHSRSTPENATETEIRAVHGGSELTDRDAASCANNPNIRFEWRQYSQSDRVAFVGAIKCLMNKPPSGAFPPAANRYEDFARIHQLYMPNVHNNAKFLVWHRYYLWAFEQVLRRECGFDRAMVWWDETLDAGNFAKSDIFSAAYFGGLPTNSGGNSFCINDGTFGGATLDIGPGTSDVAHCMSRGVDESLTSQCSSGYINYCNTMGDYASFEQCIEYG
jgi:tyrosinase